jgi:hypothetical protein
VRPVNKFTRFYNFLANMGLVIRDDPPKVIDLTGREWGPAFDGLALSIRELPREDARQVTGISVVMRNGGAEPRKLNVPPWVFFYRISGLELTPYGRQFMNAGHKGQNTEVTLGPGDAIETDLPVSTMYNLRALGDYKVQVSCTLPDGAEMNSNEIVIRV